MIEIVGTGLSGLVGSRFQALYGDRYAFTNLDLTVGVDITNAEHVDNAIRNAKAASVIHLAAFTNVSAAHEENGNTEGSCYKVNVIGTKNIAEAAKRYGKYLIHISTDYVFDGTKETPYVESDEPHPIEWYGKTKYLAEQEVQKADGKYVILRLAFPYQAKPSRPDFLKNIIDKLTQDTLPPAFTNHTITPTFVDDFVSVFDYCVREQPTGLYHATGSSAHTDFEIASLVREVFGLTGSVCPGDLDEYLKTITRPYQRTMLVCNAKLEEDFGMQMKTFREGLAEVLTQLTHKTLD